MSTYDVICNALLLSIRPVEVSDPVVTFVGANWSLTLVCPWTLEGPGVSSSWESESVADEVWELVGREIVSVSSDENAVDPVFEISGETTLAIQADSDLDPWTLILSDIVVVGQKSHQSTEGVT